MNSQSLAVPGAAENQPATPVQVSVRTPDRAEADPAAFPYRALHQALRGRYPLAICLGMTLATALGVAGWHTSTPLYRSDALLRIAYDRPRVSQGSDDQRSSEAFEAFMQSQQALLTSNRLLAEAAKGPLWRELGYQPGQLHVEDLASELTVERRSGAEHIKVSSTTADPQRSATIVRSVVNAYVNLYNAFDKQAASERTAALESRRKELAAQREQLDTALRNEAIEFGSANVERFYDAAVQRLTRVESALIDVRIALAMVDRPGGASAAPRYATPQQIARVDPRMAKYLSDREDMEVRLQELRMRGYGEEHNQVLHAKKAIELAATRIRDYALELQRSGFEPAGNSPALQGQTTGLSARSASELKVDEGNLSALNREVKEQMASLGAKRIKVEGIRAEMDRLHSDLAEVDQRLAVLQLEAGLSGRLSVLSNGEVPLLPVRDRRMHMAVAGAVGGLLLPSALIAAMGLLRRRYRYSDDASDDLEGHIPLLGILPQLPDRLTDMESAADAAQCVHHIRVRLQARSDSSVCYLMTSACPGEGKTSLTAALALSFATAGARTLAIDGDLIGQRLTRGYQMEDRPGFREAMQYGLNEGMTYPAGVPGLWILPAGVSDGRDACAVSGSAVKRLLTSVREHYDVVLIDSGPILGSIEAMVIAGTTDGVVLTISRRQQKPIVDRAIRHLRSVNARIAGMVFNKAEPRDFRRSVSAASLRSIPRNTDSGVLMKVGVTTTSGFGSLVDSVQTYLPTAD